MYSIRRILKSLAWLIAGTPPERRRVLQECARIASGAFGGFYINEDYKRWILDREFMAVYRRFSPGNPYSAERKYFLRELARLVKNVPGSIAECGSYEGASAYLIASELPDTPIHLFDSFEGLPAPSNEDRSADSMWKKGDLTAREETIRENLRRFSNIVIHKGWIPDTFAAIADERFRLVHIDVDLYKPTLDSLAFLYPRMNRGGIIVMDDYGFTNCEGAFAAAQEYMSDKPEPIVQCPTGQGIIFKSYAPA